MSFNALPKVKTEAVTEDKDAIYACKCLPLDFELPRIGDDVMHIMKAFLDNIEGDWRKLIFLHSVSVELDKNRALLFMKHCSRDDPSLKELVERHAGPLIYKGEKNKEVKLELELLKKNQRDCKAFKDYYEQLLDKVYSWKYAGLRWLIFRKIEEVLMPKVEIKLDMPLPELLKKIIARGFKSKDLSKAVQLLATLRYMLDNPQAEQVEIEEMWMQARLGTSKKKLREKIKQLLEHLQFIAELINLRGNQFPVSGPDVKVMLKEQPYQFLVDFLIDIFKKNHPVLVEE